MYTNVYNYLFTKRKFSRSQDKWECDLNLKLHGLRTTGSVTPDSHVHAQTLFVIFVYAP